MGGKPGAKRSAKTRARMRKASKARSSLTRAEGPNEIDIAVGKNLKRIRTAQNMTQSELAEQVGVRFQQIQKYECAVNRISASRLAYIAKTLDVKVSVLFGEHNGEKNASLDKMKELDVAKAVRLYMLLDSPQRSHIRKTMSIMLREGE